MTALPLNQEHETPALVALAADLLQRQARMLATAESCTGGLVAAACTDLAGSSAWFERGFVTYSNAAKSELLGVDAALIAAHGAVSEPVARAMAEGAVARSRAQVALAITGVAGPGGGTPGKPVGTVWFGWSVGGLVRTGHRRFDGDRATVRAAAVHHALHTLVALLRFQGEKAMSDIVFTDNTARRRYEAQRDGTLAGFVNYRREGDVVTLSHTEVLPAHEGQGLGSTLARHVLGEARSQGWRVNPTCGFLAAWIARHDEYLDLVRLDSPPPAAG